MRGIEGAGRPAAIRCGCFLPDLTRLADANVHPTPGSVYGGLASSMQVGPRQRRKSGDQLSAEIVGVSLQLQLPWRRLVNDGVDAVLFGIGDRGFLAREFQLELAARVAAAGPAHQGIGLARLGWDEVEDPLVSPGPAGLHRVLRAL